MDAPNLPIPQLHGAIDPYHVPTTCKVTGIALCASFLVINVVTSFHAINFLTIWALLLGGGLTALGFIKNEAIKPGILVALGAGGGLVGLLTLIFAGGSAMAAPVPFLAPLGMLGAIAASFGLFLWARNGHSQIAFFVVIGGLAFIALGLLVPIRGTMPIVGMFKVLGGSGGGVLGVIVGIFMFLLSVIFVGLAVLTLLFVVLKGDKADKAWIALSANAMFIVLPAALAITALLFIFMSASTAIVMLFMAVLLASFLWLTVSNAVILLDAVRAGTIQGMFK